MAEVTEKSEDMATTTTMQEVVIGGAAAAAAERRRRYLAAEDVGAPATAELVGWHAYALCTYFVHTFLLPVLFPLLVAYTSRGYSGEATPAGNSCSSEEAQVYQRLVVGSISLAGTKFSPLAWTAISWGAGVVLAAPVTICAAYRLDRHGGQILVLSVTIVAGTFFCLVTGFFRTVWLFPLYIVAVAMAATVGSAAHTRNLAVIVRGIAAGHSFSRRSSASSRLSSHATAAGCFGALLISAFAFRMLRHSDKLISLWVVSIFSGLLWFVSLCYVFFSGAGAAATAAEDSTAMSALYFPSKWTHFLSPLRYRHAAGGLVAVFLSSFLSICIFTSGVLHVAGHLCDKGVILLALWIVYFAFPMLSLPLLNLAQRLVRADAVRMQVLGFFVSAAVAGAGFYYKNRHWSVAVVLMFGLVQGSAAAVLHAFGGVLLVDCSPPGKEGAFAGVLVLSRSAGSALGFGIAAAYSGGVRVAFGASFLAAMAAILVLVFGNVSHSGGDASGADVSDDGASPAPARGSERDGNGGGGVWRPSVHLQEKEVQV